MDFDGESARRAYAQSKIPADLASRVFVLGSLKEPENLKKDLGSPERIGEDEIWHHRLLDHNRDEVLRLGNVVRPFLFG